MTQKFLLDAVFKRFSAKALLLNRGIEREALRVNASGNLAKNPHPKFLGSKLTHPTITTDFSESQLELITPVSNSIEETLRTLGDIHRYVNAGLEDEILWATSMPCLLRGDAEIPLAYYGESNIGKLKTIYRSGLGARYGRSMQTICAVHYNVSFNDHLWQQLAQIEGQQNNPAYRTRRYFDAMRNFRRFSWLPIILTGASPAVCNSFVKGRRHALERFDQSSLYKPYGTSLRNGNLGYQSDAQGKVMDICYNSLGNYVGTLANAVCQPFPEYSRLGIEEGGQYIQVNDAILQSEAEFYTTIRAKCVPPRNSNFLLALLDGGVEYVEIRLLDVNPFEPLGIDATSIRFLDTLLLYCLLIDSPEHDQALCRSVNTNVTTVVTRGRDTGTLLNDKGTKRSIADWGKALLQDLLRVSAYLDPAQHQADKPHQHSIEQQIMKLHNPNLTPSGQMLAQMKQQRLSFFRFAMNQSLQHKQYFLAQRLSTADRRRFEDLAADSFATQSVLEALPQDDFGHFLKTLQAQYQQLAKQLYPMI